MVNRQTVRFGVYSPFTIHHLRLFQANAGAETRLSLDDADDVTRGSHVEDDDGKIVVHAQRDRRCVHYLELFFEYFEISNTVESRRGRILNRVGLIDSVNLRGLDNYVGFDFQGPQRGG